MLLSICVSCKPTENNYKSAYDIARGQKEKEQQQDAELGIPAEGFIPEDGPRKENAGEAILNVKAMPLKYVEVDGDNKEKSNSIPQHLHRWNVAVSKYKMSTNAFAQINQLRKSGINAVCAKSNDDYLYVVALTCDDKQNAETFMLDFIKKHKKYSYVGLDGAPLLIEGINIIRVLPERKMD